MIRLPLAFEDKHVFFISGYLYAAFSLLTNSNNCQDFCAQKKAFIIHHLYPFNKQVSPYALFPGSIGTPNENLYCTVLPASNVAANQNQFCITEWLEIMPFLSLGKNIWGKTRFFFMFVFNPLQVTMSTLFCMKMDMEMSLMRMVGLSP